MKKHPDGQLLQQLPVQEVYQQRQDEQVGGRPVSKRRWERQQRETTDQPGHERSPGQEPLDRPSQPAAHPGPGGQEVADPPSRDQPALELPIEPVGRRQRQPRSQERRGADHGGQIPRLQHSRHSGRAGEEADQWRGQREKSTATARRQQPRQDPGSGMDHEKDQDRQGITQAEGPQQVRHRRRRHQPERAGHH